MPAQIIDLQRFRLLRRADQAECDESILPWSVQHWPMCRIRSFVQNTPPGRPPRSTCGRVYTRATLQARAPLLTAIVRSVLADLGRRGAVTMPALVGGLQAHAELTSVERAAFSTGPCACCPVLAEQTQQLHFLWGLYRAYWGRGCSARRLQTPQGQLAADQSRRSAIDLRVHIRQEIGLIRHLQRQLALCPWVRRRPAARSDWRAPGC